MIAEENVIKLKRYSSGQSIWKNFSIATSASQVKSSPTFSGQSVRYYKASKLFRIQNKDSAKSVLYPILCYPLSKNKYGSDVFDACDRV